MEEHNGATMDKKTDLGAEYLEYALLEVVEQVEEHLASELDVVVGLDCSRQTLHCVRH